MNQYRSPSAALLVIAFIALAGVGLSASLVTLSRLESPRIVRVGSVTDLQRAFDRFGYSLDAARGSGRVPRLAISDVPRGWQAGLDTAKRKRVFFETMLPLVLIANDKVRADRHRLNDLAKRLADDRPLRAGDRKWLARLAERYDLDWPSGDATDADRDMVAALLQRVGPVPPSLALAQAAIESGYGTSRFAVTGNALFGQWTSGGGLTPARQRAAKAAWSVAAYASPLRSVEAYLRNLNTHRAYRDFRRARQRMEDGGALSGPALAPTLAAYSEKGPAYTETLREIIRTNRLDELDRVALEPGRPIRLVIP